MCGAHPLQRCETQNTRVLSMATLTATRCHPVITAFYQRLLARGTSQKVARTAAMRKLLIILNALVKSHTSWNAHLKQNVRLTKTPVAHVA